MATKVTTVSPSVPSSPSSSTTSLPLWLGAVRLILGWVFLWAFLDKLFGWGLATPTGQAWVDGVSPTLGFLKNATSGPFHELYASLGGVAIVDWLYMIGLVAVGLALLTGVGLKIAGLAGAAMMVLFWAAVLPPEHNPFADEHVVYFLLLIAISVSPRTFARLSVYDWWTNTPFVRRYTILT